MKTKPQPTTPPRTETVTVRVPTEIRKWIESRGGSAFLLALLRYAMEQERE